MITTETGMIIMYTNLKNFELMRHYIGKYIQQATSKLIRAQDKNSTQIICVIFSTTVYPFVSYFVSNTLPSLKPLESHILVFVICLLLFFVLLQLGNVICKIKKYIRYKTYSYCNTITDQIVLKSDFDHIANDSAMIALKFMIQFKDDDENDLMRKFDFLETKHYIEKSLKITIELLKNPDCIRTPSNYDSNNINPARISVLLEIQKDVISFLHIESTKISIDSKLDAWIKLEIETLNNNFTEAETDFKTFLSKYYTSSPHEIIS